MTPTEKALAALGIVQDMLRNLRDKNTPLLGPVQQKVREAIAALKEDPWIPVETRLPEVDEWVYVYSDGVDDFAYDIAYLMKDGTWRNLGWNYPVTHWQPLPAPPKQ